MATKKFKCTVCGYIHEGKAAPETCPVCAAPASAFVEIEDAKKKGMLSDKNGNAYIIMYSTVMVVIVATLLAVAALSLQKRQDANEPNEKKSSILSSLSAQDRDYRSSTPTSSTPGREGRSRQDVFELLKDLPGAFDDGKFPVFEAKDGRVVIPVTGTGLWAHVWGYVALEKDMDTMAGIIMAHKGETPGLGAEIATPNSRRCSSARRFSRATSSFP